MIYVAAGLTIVFFIIALRALKVVHAAAKAIQTTKIVTNTALDPDLDEESKEEAFKKASLSLLRHFISIFFRGSISIAISIVPAVTFDFMGLAAFEDIMDLLLSWEVIVIASIIMILPFYFFRRRQ